MFKNIKFFSGVLTLMAGTAISQIIAIIAYPLLARLYSPEEMGLMAFFIGACAVLAVILTGRYELAIVMSKTDREADNVVALSFFMATILFIICLLFVFIFRPYIISVSNNVQIGDWLYSIPISAFLICSFQIMNYLGTRLGAFKKLAIASALQQLIYVFFAVLFGIWIHLKDGLILSRIISFAGIAIISMWIFQREIRKAIKSMSINSMKECAFVYKQFLFCNVPYSLLGAFSKELIIFSFVAFGHSYGAGLYALARNMLYLPIYFLSTTLGQAFYKESAKSIGTPYLEQLVMQLFNSIIIFAVPGLIFFLIWVHEIFSICFGHVWQEAGTYAAIFTPAAFLFLFTSWTERLFEVNQKQYISLAIQVIFDSLSILSVCLFLSFKVSLINCIICYTIISCAYHVTYLMAIFGVSKFDFLKLIDSASRILILTCVSIVLLYLPCIVFRPLLVQFISGLSLLLGYYSFILYHNTRSSQYFNLKFLTIR